MLKAVTRSVSMKKGILRNFTKSTGKHLYRSLYFKKETQAQEHRTPLDDCFYFVQYLKNFVLVFRISRKQFQKQQSREVCCPVNLLHIFRTPFSRNTYEQLLLQFETEVLQNPLKKLVISVLNYHKFKKKNCFFHLKLVYGCLKIPNCIAHWDQRVCWNLRTASSNIS